MYSEQRLGKKNTRLGSLDSALLGMNFTWVEVELSKSIMRNTSANFFGISCQFIFERGERRLIQAGFWKWNFKKAVKRRKVHAPAFTCFSCPCEFVLQHLCYWAQNSKESMFLFQPTASQFWSLVNHYKGSRGITKFSLCKYIISTYYLFSFPGKLFFIISPHTALDCPWKITP